MISSITKTFALGRCDCSIERMSASGETTACTSQPARHATSSKRKKFVGSPTATVSMPSTLNSGRTL